MSAGKKSDLYLHSLMCIIGGFMGAYALLIRFGNFGSSQTSNMIYIITGILGGNNREVITRIFAMLFYILGIALFSFLNKKSTINMQRYSILVDMAAFVILCLIPMKADPVIGLYPILFMASTQWQVFGGTDGYVSSTIFSTNNISQVVKAVVEYSISRNRSHLMRAKYYTNSLLWYHIGVAAAFFACRKFEVYASLWCFIPAFFALLATFSEPQFVSAFLCRVILNQNDEA